MFGQCRCRLTPRGKLTRIVWNFRSDTANIQTFLFPASVFQIFSMKMLRNQKTVVSLQRNAEADQREYPTHRTLTFQFTTTAAFMWRLFVFLSATFWNDMFVRCQESTSCLYVVFYFSSGHVSSVFVCKDNKLYPKT